MLEFNAGRSVGHFPHYARALEQALDNWQLTVWAPYRDGWAWQRRPWSWLQKLFLGWRAFHPPRGRTRVVIAPTAFLPEKTSLCLALLPPRRDVIGAFVLRRTGAGRWDLPITRIVVGTLIRRGWLYPVSDSRLVLREWERRTGMPGAEVAIPPPPGASVPPSVVRRDGPTLAFLGSLRTEKGAAHYGTIIRSALDHLPNVTVHVQLGGGTAGDGSLAIADRLRSEWQGHPAVHLHEGYLADDEYGRLLAGADVVVLPYEAASYGTGTSGVLHEALALGVTVLTTPFPWAMERYADHPQVRFLENLEPSTLERELQSAARAAVSRRADPPPTGAEFQRDWDRAIEGALERLRRRARSI